MSNGPLHDRIALVTGFSRSAGIAAAVAKRLVDDGATVVATGWVPHDVEMTWGPDAQSPEDLAAEIDDGRGRLSWVPGDFMDPGTPGRLVDTVVERHGAIDIMAAIHARTNHGGLADVTVDELDKSWAINARGSLLLAQAMFKAYDQSRGSGRIIFFTSGQHIEPMGTELAYIVSKGAIHQMTASVADQVADAGITANCINPGPCDTGWAQGDLYEEVREHFPTGRWGTPTDVANLVAFLAGPEGGWMNGQVLNTEGGFRR